MRQGDLVNLRHLKISDWKKIINWHNNIELSNQLMSHPFPVTDELEKKWLKDR